MSLRDFLIYNKRPIEDRLTYAAGLNLIAEERMRTGKSIENCKRLSESFFKGCLSFADYCEPEAVFACLYEDEFWNGLNEALQKNTMSNEAKK